MGLGTTDNSQRTTDNGQQRRLRLTTVNGQRTIVNGRRGMLKVERGERVLRFQGIKIVKILSWELPEI